jgi:hypothetical protein
MAASPGDLLLAQYVECPDPIRSEALLEQLVVEHAQPAIRKVVRYKLAFQGRSESQDVEDVAGDVVVELIARLQSVKSTGDVDAIGSFSGYTAVAAYHACNEYLRRKYPNRHRLKNRLRYLLNAEPGFAIWEVGAEWLCGTAKWQKQGRAAVSGDRLARARELLSDLPHGPDAMHPATLLSSIFERMGGPIPFDEAVEMLAWLWGVDDPAALSEAHAREVPTGETQTGLRMELTQWLSTLWQQIRALPRAQQIALLLNLRSGADTAAVTLLPVTGVASIVEIAETLGIASEEFAEMWNSLPLDDLAIARHLGLTRQQVINLRKSARERLIRRVGGKSFSSDSNMRAKRTSHQVER